MHGNSRARRIISGWKGTRAPRRAVAPISSETSTFITCRPGHSTDSRSTSACSSTSTLLTTSSIAILSAPAIAGASPSSNRKKSDAHEHCGSRNYIDPSDPDLHHATGRHPWPSDRRRPVVLGHGVAQVGRGRPGPVIDVCEHAAHDLAGRGHRYLCRELDRSRNLVGGEMLSAMGDAKRSAVVAATACAHAASSSLPRSKHASTTGAPSGPWEMSMQ